MYFHYSLLFNDVYGFTFPLEKMENWLVPDQLIF